MKMHEQLINGLQGAPQFNINKYWNNILKVILGASQYVNHNPNEFFFLISKSIEKLFFSGLW